MRNLWVSRAKAWLTEREVAAIHGRMARIEELLLSARRGPGKSLYAVSWVLAPLAADKKRASRQANQRQAR